MHFDSLGVRGEALPMSPRCKPVLLVRGGMAYLRTTSDALAPGACGRDR